MPAKYADRQGCPKCGTKDIAAYYVYPKTFRNIFLPPPTRDTKIKGEALRVICLCGFMWDVPCMDVAG